MSPDAAGFFTFSREKKEPRGHPKPRGSDQPIHMHLNEVMPRFRMCKRWAKIIPSQPPRRLARIARSMRLTSIRRAPNLPL